MRKKEQKRKLEKKISKFRIGIVLLIFFLTLSRIIGIYAYLTSKDLIIRNYEIGECSISIDNEGEIPDFITPGMEIKKNIQITNTGPVDCYVRIKILFTDSNMENLSTADYNTTDYYYNSEDNYYYYPKRLKKGEKTENLLTTININNDALEKDLKNFDIIVYAEAVQSTGFINHISAWETLEKNKYN